MSKKNNIQFNIEDSAVCQKCFDRIYKTPERKRNAKIRIIHDNEKCSICDNLLLHEDKIYQLILKKLHMLKVEFNTFLIACQVTSDTINRNEKNIYKLIGYKGKDSLKRHIRRDIGLMIENKLNKEAEFKFPEIVILIKIRKKRFDFVPFEEIANVNVFIDLNPMYIEGKYRKLVRDIPQTKWPCYTCKGKGCPDCNFTGQQYADTVEGLISKPLLKLTRGDDVKFHGSGREDIDVRMLGNGRPFVIEVKHPYSRNINLKFLRRLVNSHSDGKIEIHDLKFVDKERKATIKNSSVESYKVYAAIAEFDKGLTSEDIQKIEDLKKIEQRTPNRVDHRRADIIRTRVIKDLSVKRINSKKLCLTIKCQGGLYIKELISGDNGRTNPSLSSITNSKAVCTQLDVLEVHIPK